MWHFRTKMSGEVTRDPIVGEFFSTDAIKNPAEALVREGVQNSIDARNRVDLPVHVRVCLATGAWALPATAAEQWFASGWQHFAAKGNGIRVPPNPKSACTFLVFEDFNTRGLQGDPAQDEEREEAGDAGPRIDQQFYTFFRAEGRSNKHGGDGGRWGVGKHVFARSSGINAIFGLTVRSDDHRRLLMGHATLRSHRLDGKSYTPDGFFGDGLAGTLALAEERTSVLDAFASAFRLERRADPGLSVVVPYVDKDITHPRLVAGFLRDYFWLLMRGRLKVTIESPDTTTQLDASTLDHVIAEYTAELDGEFAAAVGLARWYEANRDNPLESLGMVALRRNDWNKQAPTQSALKATSTALERGDVVQVRCPISVQRSGQAEVASYFDVVLQSAPATPRPPAFVRDGIVVSDVRASRLRGIRCLVLIEDRPIATLLGDAENPAHTQWQKDSSRFKDIYVDGGKAIEYVTKAASCLVEWLRATETDVDNVVLADFFPLIEPGAPLPLARPDRGRRQPSQGPVPPPPPPPPPRPKRYRLTRIDGGFTIRNGDGQVPTPATMRILVAYDTNSPKPFSKYNPLDFDVGTEPIACTVEGGSVDYAGKNELHVAIVEQPFCVTVTGFDRLRDIIVRTSLEGIEDAA